MSYDRSQTDEIKEKIDIVNLISKYVEIRPAGKNYLGLCPFHNEKTPSFIVSPDIQRYKCFGCGKSGDIFNFVQEIENIDFLEALEKLAKEAGVELKEFKKNPKTEKLFAINREAAKYYYLELKKKGNEKAYQYLKKDRAFTQESIKDFALGYAPGKRDLLEFIKKSGTFSEKDLLDSGLFTKKNGALNEKFFKRIMFPIRNTRGKFVGFSGRVLPGDDFGPKYMNTPETGIFHKKDNLFGLYESRQEIRKLDLAILCEGQTDVISAHQNGIKNIVAPLGTALTKEQLQKLSLFTRNILFFFDSDEAGQQAMVRAFKMASELNLNPYAASPKPYKDLDELIKEDLKDLNIRIEKKRDAFTFLLTSFVEKRDLTNYSDYNKTQKFLSELLSTVKDSTAMSFYKKKAKKIVGALGNDIKVLDEGKSSNRKEMRSKASHENSMPLNEKSYLQLILLRDKISIPQEHNLELFSSEEIKDVLTFIKKNPNKDRSHIFENSNPDLVEDLIFTSSKALTSSADDIEKDIEQIYKNIERENVERKKKQLSVKIAIAEEKGELKESKRLLEEYQKLVK